MKKCNKCKETKELSEFGKLTANKDGLRTWCKPCMSEYQKQYRIDNPEKSKQWQKQWHKNNPEYLKEWYENNSEKVKENSKKWHENNSEKVKEIRKKYTKNKLKNDINYRLACNLRSRLNYAIRNNQKIGSAVKDLGCSIDVFKGYFETLFTPGMNWDNYGINGWHIDHIKPLALFDLTDREQFLKAVHYSNLQPMWAEDNLKKGKKYEKNEK